METRSYKLDELAREAGTSARTVRYYVQRGLLPAPAFRGKDTGYDREHLVRLRAIRRLQEAFYPLDAIAAELASRPLADIERIADGRLVPSDRHAPAARPAPARDDDTSPRDPGRHAHDILQRFTLAPGVELTITDDAPEESRRVVAKILDSLQASSRIREGREPR